MSRSGRRPCGHSSHFGPDFARRRSLCRRDDPYTYDARGRLVKVSRGGTVNNNVVSNYTYDKADNRTNKNTTGAP